VDAAIAARSIRQHGNINHDQLIAIGVSDSSIARRIRSGRLYRVHRGVYSVGRPPTTPLERASAAVLACGPGAALSHASAMTLWGFSKHWSTPFEVTVSRDRRPTGIKVRLATTLGRRDIRIQLGIRVTSPARTLLDNAPRLNDRQLKRAVKEAIVSSHVKKDHLTDLLDRHPHHPGTKYLAPFVALSGHTARSGPELGFPAFCERWDLPCPQMNFPIAGYVVDAYFPDHELIVELDSHVYHLNPISFETDRDRDADTLLAGVPTVRITHERMTQTPRKEADRLKAILEQRAAQLATRAGGRSRG
jgi:hypothetical protein